MIAKAVPCNKDSAKKRIYLEEIFFFLSYCVFLSVTTELLNLKDGMPQEVVGKLLFSGMTPVTK